mmetsp:Transcript_29977/g.26547  ORF Transcript_29977/g.26547 Transcript_29977/m.26547 type:complete len:433 (-) Transcript_29977:18-1316(-)
MDEIRELLKLAASKLNKTIEMDDLISIMRLYSAFPIGGDKFYNRLHKIANYKLQFMRPEEVATSFLTLSMLYRNPSIKVDFGKFMNMAIYKILKSVHSLKPDMIADIIHSLGQSKLANKKVMKSYKSIISRKMAQFDPNSSYRIFIGWISSGKYVEEDQHFCNKLYERIRNEITELKNYQLTNLYYILYGKSLTSLQFDYYDDLEEIIFERCHEFDFKQLAQVLATFKFIEKKFPDSRFENALEDYLEKLVPREVNYLLRYFYNDKVDLGLSQRIQERLEEIIKDEAGEMNSEELSLTYSSLALSQKTSPKLLEYLEENIKQNEKGHTLESIIQILNLKTQGAAEFFTLEKIGAPAVLKLLRQKDFTAQQYTTIVLLFTALKYFDEAFWKEVLSYLDQVNLPNSISYMQLHSSLSVVANQIDIGEEMKLLEK